MRAGRAGAILSSVSLERRLTDALASREDVAAAWLFGSRARGTATASSDVDVAVLLTEAPEDPLDRYRFDLANDLAATCGAAVDLVVVNDASADLVHRVLRDGVLLVDRDRSRRIAFEVKKRAEYLDLVPVRRAYRRQPQRP